MLFPLFFRLCCSDFPDGSTGTLTLFPPTEHWINVPIDHFTFDSSNTFPLRYLVYSEWWEGAASKSGAVLFYCGNEGSVYGFYNATALMFEIAKEIGALVVFSEHRYYGESLPFGAASLSPPNIRYLTIEHALADYSVLLSALPDLFSCPNKQCKVVLFGGSYGGMLAVWHRFKYPHLSVGVISAGAPIDLYPGEGKQVLFWNATLHTFSKYGGQRQQGWDCAKVVDWTLDITRRYAQTSGGLSLLSNVFHSCDNLTNVSGAGQKLLFYIQGALAGLALFDYPYPCDFMTPMPANPVLVACSRLPLDPQTTSDYTALLALNDAVNIYVNYTGQLKCKDFKAEVVGESSAGNVARLSTRTNSTWSKTNRSNVGDDDFSIAWNYQACVELILEPLSSDGFGFYPEDDNQINDVINWCNKRYGVFPRPSQILQSTGGSNIQSLTNVMLSDGEKDPWRVGGVVQSPNPSVEVMVIEGGAHHQEFRFADSRESPAVQVARDRETDLVKKWVGFTQE